MLSLLGGVYIIRNVTIAVSVPAGAAAPLESEIEAAFEAAPSPLTPRVIGLVAALAVVILIQIAISV